MRAEDIFTAFNDVDDAHINITQKEAKRNFQLFRTKKRLSIAACIAVLVGTIYMAIPHLLPLQTPVYPSNNLKYSQGDVTDCETEAAYYDYTDLSHKADLIIVADVDTTFKEPAENGYVHYASVCVRKVLKGNLRARQTLYIKDTAFSFTDSYGKLSHSITFDGGPMLENGNRVLLFLYKSNNLHTSSCTIELYEYVCRGLGKFFYDQDGKFYNSVLYNDDFPHQYTPSVQLVDYRPKTLKEIKELIV